MRLVGCILFTSFPDVFFAIWEIGTLSFLRKQSQHKNQLSRITATVLRPVSDARSALIPMS